VKVELYSTRGNAVECRGSDWNGTIIIMEA